MFVWSGERLLASKVRWSALIQNPDFSYPLT